MRMNTGRQILGSLGLLGLMSAFLPEPSASSRFDTRGNKVRGRGRRKNKTSAYGDSKPRRFHGYRTLPR